MAFDKFRVVALALTIAALLGGPAAEATPNVPTAREVDAMCPGIGLTGLSFGAGRTAQDASAVAQIKPPHDAFAPFTEVDLDYTDWSDRLAAVTWRAASPEGDTNLAWREALEEELADAGWIASVHRDLSSTFAMNSSMVEKAFVSGGVTRTILIEYDTPGMLLLRCGDAALLEQDKRERRGDLPAGSPRPAIPATQPLVLPKETDCEGAEMRAAFADAVSFAQIGPVIEARFPSPEPGGHAERLNRWLEWKLRISGKVTQQRLDDIAETAAPVGAAEIKGMEETMGVMGQAINADKSRDPVQICRAMITALRQFHDMRERKDARWTRHNAALEAEARKMGIAVD